MSAQETQDALDGYDKEGHAQAQMDREDKLIAAGEEVLYEFNVRGKVTLTTLAKLGVAIQEVRSERKKKGIPVITQSLKDGQGSGGQL